MPCGGRPDPHEYRPPNSSAFWQSATGGNTETGRLIFMYHKARPKFPKDPRMSRLRNGGHNTENWAPRGYDNAD